MAAGAVPGFTNAVATDVASKARSLTRRTLFTLAQTAKEKIIVDAADRTMAI
jgi:hypothetical protein